MSRIELKGVTVEFPIFSANSRSLKNAVLSATTGGRVGKDRHNYVCVRALDQVSIEIQHGERVGLVGHNGAGKTTLLRVIAGIYEPLQGSVIVEGTPTPMFDVSLGIDADATGLENIVLRGLYMGLSKAEILRKMDDVAGFTELGQFLDLPVRTYSEGMRARLAFAMATCIEPDILLLDEGIGAGDAAFFERANQRLESFIHSTGILVLASHSEELTRKFCNRIALIEHGQVVWYGDLEEGYDRYHDAILQRATLPGPSSVDGAGSGRPVTAPAAQG
jgi:ABC-2 type transport system ATP-binding protein/lipopolysaccharide transport system ATP-binding protein